MFNFGFGIGQSNRGLCVGFGDGRHGEDEGGHDKEESGVGLGVEFRVRVYQG